VQDAGSLNGKRSKTDINLIKTHHWLMGMAPLGLCKAMLPCRVMKALRMVTDEPLLDMQLTGHDRGPLLSGAGAHKRVAFYVARHMHLPVSPRARVDGRETAEAASLQVALLTSY
jgi:hypothetical protein